MLVPCPECRRHVRAGDACPFCGATTPQASSPEPTTAVRLSRAMLVASVVGVAACTTSRAALYGGPPTPEPVPTVSPEPSTSASAAPSTSAEAPGPIMPPVALYGAPPAPGPK